MKSSLGSLCLSLPKPACFASRFKKGKGSVVDLLPCYYTLKRSADLWKQLTKKCWARQREDLKVSPKFYWMSIKYGTISQSISINKRSSSRFTNYFSFYRPSKFQTSYIIFCNGQRLTSLNRYPSHWSRLIQCCCGPQDCCLSRRSASTKILQLSFVQRQAHQKVLALHCH